MHNTNIFIRKIDGSERSIDWTELNQLKKDILWVFDENGGELHNAFIPEYSFNLPYWEYLTIDGDRFFLEEQKQFFKEGALIIVLCMVAEIVDIQGGSQLLFGDTKMKDIIHLVERFNPINENQATLKEIVSIGLTIAASITKDQIAKNEDLEHPMLLKFYSMLPWVSKTFVQTYYKSKVRRT
jgi:hypothetical protein